MDPTLYRAAMEGKIRGDGHFILADHLKRDEENGYQVTAAKGNTILHVAAIYGHSHFVEEVLEICPGLLCYQNRKNETALHLAAKQEHEEVVGVLLSKAGEAKEKLMRMIDDKGYTALHLAVIQQNIDCARLIWQQNKSLCEEADKRGWIPLHYAVKLGWYGGVSDMLGWKKSLAYLRAGSDNDWTTTFHIAASAGHENILIELSEQYPDWWEVLNSRGQNVLHVAIANNKGNVVSFLVDSKNRYFLTFEQDKDGNTPFDLLDVSSSSVTGKFMFRLSKRKEDLNSGPYSLDAIVSSCLPEIQEDELDPEFEKDIDSMMKAIQMHLVVATLVMTVTFAAGFTLPGGFDSDAGLNKGMAILTRNAAFRAFVIMDSIAFTLSASAIFIYYCLSDFYNAKPTLKLFTIVNKMYTVAGLIQLFAILAVAIAFVTGMYSTLQHSVGLAITVCVIGCTSFPIFFWVLYQILKDY